ncbi:MAG: phosphoribosylformylglycinamidine synthase subunit PurL [Thermoplasmatales archaeon]
MTDVSEIKILGASDKDLISISKNMSLALSLDEMRRIVSYFSSEGRNPTDVEMQSIAQAWSEHCSYKSSKIHLKKYLMDLGEGKILLRGDAGVVALNEELAVAFKMESHNHPSAIEPYGGAATGVGGILRDVLSMGAQPVAVTDVLFFGTRKVKGFPSPKFIESGVISGIRDYGNRVGIPTLSGGITYSQHFSPNVLVNVGCVGIVKKNRILSSAVREPGIKLIIAGGKTGRDGIHGVNMASETIREREDISTVQLGSPIVKEPLIHAVLEANERGLIYALKDLGGGGLSSVVSEMLQAGGTGGRINLENVPLKTEGMQPWEIWISESQERMMLAVREENERAVHEIMDSWDVTSATIGISEPGSRLVIFYKGEKVMDIDLNFLTNPGMYERPYTFKRIEMETTVPSNPPDLNKLFLRAIGDSNVRTREFAVRQYDHTVRGSTVLGPFSGIVGREGPTDAAVVRPDWNSNIGIAISHGFNPFYSSLDPYAGGIDAVDEAVRNIIAVGAEPIGFSDCLNAGNPENPVVMGEFISMLKGMREGAISIGVPFVSGNVSFYNESPKKRIPTFPTIMSVGKLNDISKTVSPDFKRVGSSIYLVGLPTTDLGGSLYFRIIGHKKGVVPVSKPENLKRRTKKVLNSIEIGYILSLHDISDGGIAVSIGEMTIGSGIGARLDISNLGLRPDFALFSEPQSSWVAEVRKDKAKDFEKLMGDDAILIGETDDSGLMVYNGEERVIDLDLGSIYRRWKRGYR